MQAPDNTPFGALASKSGEGVVVQDDDSQMSSWSNDTRSTNSEVIETFNSSQTRMNHSQSVENASVPELFMQPGGDHDEPETPEHNSGGLCHAICCCLKQQSDADHGNNKLVGHSLT